MTQEIFSGIAQDMMRTLPVEGKEGSQMNHILAFCIGLYIALATIGFIYGVIARSFDYNCAKRQYHALFAIVSLVWPLYAIGAIITAVYNLLVDAWKGVNFY
jgi:hypothetical protein